MNLKKQLEKYAELILKGGLQLKEGDKLKILVTVDYLPLVREIAKQAYKMGIIDIQYVFQDEELTKHFFRYASEEALNQFPTVKVEQLMRLCDEKYHYIAIIGENPEMLKEMDSQRLNLYNKAQSVALKPYMERMMSNEVKWLVVACATEAWATSVFPELSPSQAVDQLWKNIFDATRVSLDNPLVAWQEHDRALKRHEDFLNGARFEKFHYQAPGTDLEVYLPEEHQWVSGSAYSKDGELFFANIPTEEVFSMPHAYKVNGTICNTKPLFYMGNLLDGMTFTFKDGQVVDYDATVGKAVLDNMLATDEGAKRLGEIAIVQHDSPISNTGILFKETLFDENASCHFAFGNAYAENINYDGQLTPVKKKELGMNESGIHVDFMVGGPELKITGYKKDGTAVVILEKGNWLI